MFRTEDQIQTDLLGRIHDVLEEIRNLLRGGYSIPPEAARNITVKLNNATSTEDTQTAPQSKADQ